MFLAEMKSVRIAWLAKVLPLPLLLLLASCNSTGESRTAALEEAARQEQAQQEARRSPVGDPRAYCPKTVLRAGTETYRIFANGVKRTDEKALESLRFQGTILKIARECNYTDNALTMKVGLRGRLINGPTNESGSFTMPVRVAVTQGETVLYSQLHQVTGTIEPGTTNGTFQFIDDNISLAIPDKENIIVYAGFDEGPDA